MKSEGQIFLTSVAMALRLLGTPAGAEAGEYHGGVWRFTGLAGKCLDASGHPLGHSSPVVLYTCNATTAQDVTGPV
jgi:hypothetical protein